MAPAKLPLVAAIDGEATLPHVLKLRLWTGLVSPSLCSFLGVKKGCDVGTVGGIPLFTHNQRDYIVGVKVQCAGTSQTVLRAER